MNRTELYLRLLAFSGLYGFVLINWVDLFGANLPAYHFWLILMYFAPAATSIAMQGLEDVELTLALGLFTSLMNDILYFVAGDLLFGFHVDLLSWWAGQFGAEGWKALFTFNGGPLHFPVYSWLMGLSIYARIALVVYLSERWMKNVNTAVSSS
jgi:Zn-dependent protease with chaperone function